MTLFIKKQQRTYVTSIIPVTPYSLKVLFVCLCVSVCICPSIFKTQTFYGLLL